MVTLPSALSLGVDTPQPRRAIASYDGSAGAKAMIQGGQQVAQLGAEIQKKIEEEKKAKDTLESAQAMLKYRQDLDNIHQKLSENPNGYLTYENDFAEAESVARKNASTFVSDENKRALFDIAAQEMAMPYHKNIRNLSKSVFADKSIAVATAATEQEKRYQLSSPDPVRLGQTQFLVKNSIQPLIDNGTIDQTKGEATIRQLNVDAERTYWDAEIQRNGFEAYKKLKSMTEVRVAGGLPRDYGADTVKPYDFKRINNIKQLVESPSPYDSLFQEMGQKYGVDPKELKLRAAVESGLKPTAQAKATPYGQSGGLMQLEAKTALALGVTDRNDPRQSVEGAAKLLAKYQADTGGDQAKIDKLYYAGSEKMIGKNTEQYAANLAAVRGAGVVEPLPFQPDPDIVMSKLNDAKAYASIALRDDMRQIDDAMKFTTLVPQEKIADLADKTLKLGMVEEYKKISEFGETQKMLADFLPLPLPQQRQMLQEGITRIRGGDLSETSKVEAMRGALENKEKMLKTDPWSYLQANGLVNMPQGSVFSGDSAQVIKARRIEAQKALPMIGSMNLPLVTNDEIDQLKMAYESGKDAGAMLSALGANLDGVERGIIASEIAKKDKVLGAAMSVDPVTAAKILSGSRGKGYVSEDKFRKGVADKLSGVAIIPERQDSMIEAMYAYYKQIAMDNQDAGTEVNQKLMNEALSKVIGDVQDISLYGNPSRVIVPTGLTANYVEDKLNKMTQADLTAMGSARNIYDELITPESLLRNNRLVSSGNGIYNLLKISNGEIVLNDQGKPLVIDISKIKAPASLKSTQQIDYEVRNAKFRGVIPEGRK